MRYIKSFQNDAAIQTAVDNKELGHPYVALNESAGTIDWDSKGPSFDKQYFTIEILEDGAFINRKSGYLYRSVNGGEWEIGGSGSKTYTKGDKIRFKNRLDRPTETPQASFSGNTLAFIAYGNIESLEYGDDFIGQTALKTNSFSDFFNGCTGLKNVENLILPGTTLINGCYAWMFSGCTSIEKAPELPAATLIGTVGNGSYRNMFRGCSSLKYIKCLATNSGNYTTKDWVVGVGGGGTFVKKAGATWPTGNNGIPSGWTVIEE